MTTRHLNGTPKSKEEAREVLCAESGILFESEYVEAFTGVLESDDYFQHYIPIEYCEELSAPVIV